MADQKLLSASEISGHKSPEDCWIVVDKQVWDMTDFLDEHPGGSAGRSIVLWQIALAGRSRISKLTRSQSF